MQGQATPVLTRHTKIPSYAYTRSEAAGKHPKAQTRAVHVSPCPPVGCTAPIVVFLAPLARLPLWNAPTGCWQMVWRGRP